MSRLAWGTLDCTVVTWVSVILDHCTWKEGHILIRNSQYVPLLLKLPYCCREPCHHQPLRGRTAGGARSGHVLSPTSMPETSPSKGSVASR